MEHVGIDLGGKESQVCIRSAEGTILLERRMRSRSSLLPGRWRGSCTPSGGTARPTRPAAERRVGPPSPPRQRWPGRLSRLLEPGHSADRTRTTDRGPRQFFEQQLSRDGDRGSGEEARQARCAQDGDLV